MPELIEHSSISSETTQEFPLRQLYFYLTEGCNLRCRHCWLEPKYESGELKQPVLDFHLFQRAIDEATPLGLSSVKLTGGEPLMHPQIEQIIAELKLRKLRTTIETNGVLCTSELAASISELEQIKVAVSLDGANAETHEWVRGVKGSFNDALEGIRNLVDVGIQTQIIMTIMQHNRDQMEEIVRLAENLGVSSVKYNIVQPTARGEKLHDSGETIAIEELVKIGEWVENELASTTKIDVIYSHPVAFRPLNRLFENGRGKLQVCGIKGVMGVLASGKYALCGIGETVPELVFGEIETDKLDDVWENNQIIKDIRHRLPLNLDGICGRCMMANSCLGNCIAQNYYRTGELFNSYWYCEMAEERGLFPGTRLKSAKIKKKKSISASN